MCISGWAARADSLGAERAVLSDLLMPIGSHGGRSKLTVGTVEFHRSCHCGGGRAMAGVAAR